MDRQCVVCHQKVATFRCIQCHKPTCSDCAFKTENGAFCSRECATNYREFARAQARAPRARGGLLKPLIGLIIIAAVALFVIHKVKPDLLPWWPF
jgi:hypothetical protein